MKINLDAHLSDFNIKQACNKAISHYFPRTGLYCFAAFGIALLGYNVAAYLNRATDSGDYNYLGFAAIVPLVVLFVYLRLRRRKIWSALQAGGLRSGATRITLDEDGIHTEKRGYRTFTGWEYFDDAIETRDGLMLLIGIAEFQMIPKSAVPERVVPSELRSRILSWMSAAKSARRNE